MVGDTFEIYIQTIKEQMRYDRVEFTVTPGLKVRLIFSNPDAMDHNLIMVQPGAAAGVAIAAAKFEVTGEGAAKQWTPDSDKILFASRLLTHNESQTLEFTAPSVPGNYEYVCTFPGHWQLMRGVMVVSDTLDPKNLVAINLSTAAEATVASNRSVVEYWEFDNLKDGISAVQADRSYESGKEMFQIASCVKCHTIGGSGKAIGPDLSDVGTRYSTLELLEHIIDPALEVADEYKTFIIETKDKKEFFGQIVDENDETLSILDNPLKPETAVTVQRSNIKVMQHIAMSPMPSDLLITLNKDEIWDLVAYLQSGADASNKAFK